MIEVLVALVLLALIVIAVLLVGVIQHLRAVAMMQLAGITTNQANRTKYIAQAKELARGGI